MRLRLTTSRPAGYRRAGLVIGDAAAPTIVARADLDPAAMVAILEDPNIAIAFSAAEEGEQFEKVSDEDRQAGLDAARAELARVDPANPPGEVGTLLPGQVTELMERLADDGEALARDRAKLEEEQKALAAARTQLAEDQAKLDEAQKAFAEQQAKAAAVGTADGTFTTLSQTGTGETAGAKGESTDETKANAEPAASEGSDAKAEPGAGSAEPAPSQPAKRGGGKSAAAKKG